MGNETGSLLRKNLRAHINVGGGGGTIKKGGETYGKNHGK